MPTSDQGLVWPPDDFTGMTSARVDHLRKMGSTEQVPVNPSVQGGCARRKGGFKTRDVLVSLTITGRQPNVPQDLSRIAKPAEGVVSECVASLLKIGTAFQTYRKSGSLAVGAQGLAQIDLWETIQ